jgi:hypothetical protein
MGDSTKTILPAGHVRVPAVAIGALSVALVSGLHGLGLLAQFDSWVAGWLMLPGAGGFSKSLPAVVVWAATVFMALGLSFALLSVAGFWRRIILWVSSLAIIAGWGPVLSLAAHAPEIGAPFIAALWSGICALVYSSRHLMAADAVAESKSNADLPT